MHQCTNETAKQIDIYKFQGLGRFIIFVCNGHVETFEDELMYRYLTYVDFENNVLKRPATMNMYI